MASSKRRPRPSPQAIREMIQAARAGDVEQRGQVLEVFRPYLVVIALAKLDPRVQAKCAPSDAAQATIIKAHGAFALFGGSGPDSLRRWLDEIQSNVVHDIHRRYLGAKKRAADRERLLDDVESQTRLMEMAVDLANHDSPSAAYSKQERAALVAEALTRLSDRQREVLQLKYLEQLPFEEVGRRLQISAQAARMAAIRGLKRLKDNLESGDCDVGFHG